MTSGPAPGFGSLALRDRLASLQSLLVLSMVMTESGDERHILGLAATAVPSLALSRLFGVHVREGGWRATSGLGDRLEVRDDVEAQFAVLSEAGGAVGVVGEGWAWAYPLRSLEGHFGHLVVSADQEPPAAEQFLLRNLAQQTGIALANARLHARERATAEELRIANVDLARTVSHLVRSTEIHDRLTRVAAAGAGEAGIAKAVHELTGYAVAAEDRHGNLRAWAGPGRPEPYPKRPGSSQSELLRRGLRSGGLIRDGARLLAVAGPLDDVLGVLTLIDPEGTAGEQEQTALEHGATVLALELARLKAVAETELRLGRDLVEELLVGTDEESATGRARALGYDLERPHRVVVVACDRRRRSPGTDGLLQAVRRAARALVAGSLVSPRGSQVVLLADAERPWGRFHAAVRAELSGPGCRVAVGGLCLRPGEFPRSYAEACFALRLQEGAGAPARVTAFDDLGVYRILADVQDVAAVERFAMDWLGPLIEYDARRHAELVLTLSRYLEHGRGHEATATALAVHRSTLRYRLRRITEISGHDLGDPDTHFNLQLATRAWRTLWALRTRS